MDLTRFFVSSLSSGIMFSRPWHEINNTILVVKRNRYIFNGNNIQLAVVTMVRTQNHQLQFFMIHHFHQLRSLSRHHWGTHHSTTITIANITSKGAYSTVNQASKDVGNPVLIPAIHFETDCCWFGTSC